MEIMTDLMGTGLTVKELTDSVLLFFEGLMARYDDDQRLTTDEILKELAELFDNLQQDADPKTARVFGIVETVLKLAAKFV